MATMWRPPTERCGAPIGEPWEIVCTLPAGHDCPHTGSASTTVAGTISTLTLTWPNT